nr:DNA-binding protein [uncultured Devosia sp.]
MSAEIASLDRVRETVELLRRRGVAPTADRVIGLLGGGSKTTVLAHLKRLREATEGDNDIPQHVIDMARGTVQEIYRAGMAVEAERVRAATERLAQALSDQEEQIEELAAQNTDLADLNARIKTRMDELDAERVELRDRLIHIAAENEKLRSATAATSIDAGGKLKEALDRVEVLLAGVEASKANTPNNPRHRITLPQKSDRVGEG